MRSLEAALSNYCQIGFAVDLPARNIAIRRPANSSIKPLAGVLGGKIKKSFGGGRFFYLHVS
jgi:hypothetical protein